MSCDYLFLRFFGVLGFCLKFIVAREAIVNGYKAQAGDIRYQAAIQIADQPPKCGGGIISNNFILTAAHCVIAHNSEPIGKSIFVIVGTLDLSIAGVVVKVEKISVPKVYNALSHPITGDIAVLKLTESLKINERNLKGLSFPTKPHVRFENRTAKIAGFGWDKMYRNGGLFGEHTDHRLRFTDTTVHSHNECMRDHPTLNLTEQHLCARARQFHHLHPAACIGDGGGPLVFKGQTVIGILSIIRIDCSEENSSSIYTRVSHYREFIYAAIGDADKDYLITHVLDA